MTFRTPNGETCPIAPGQLCEIHWADGSIYRGQYAHTVLTGKPGFVLGSTGYMGRKFRSSWDWRGIGDCIPVLRYRVFGENAFEAIRQTAENPGTAGYPCDLLPVGTTPAASVAGGLSPHSPHVAAIRGRADHGSPKRTQRPNKTNVPGLPGAADGNSVCLIAKAPAVDWCPPPGKRTQGGVK